MNEDIKYCREMLPKVSRTFAPTIRLLPGPLDLYVTTAYLLCRIADTIEDSAVLSVDCKKEMLSTYSRIFTEEAGAAFKQFSKQTDALPADTADEQLTHNTRRVLNVYQSFSAATQHNIAKWLIEMSLGMRQYAQAHHKRTFSFLRSMKELDEYMYYVAGTVGYLLTELFSYYSRKITPPLKKRMEQFAESFGKGLQLVNIIRDMSGDLKRGQSYIPDELLKKYRLTRQTIFEQENRARAEKLFNELISRAVQYLDKALDYVLLIPKKESRIRLFCMLPLFWAMRTLQIIQTDTLALLNNEKVKISRSLIRREYFLALINTRSNRLMKRHYLNIRRDFEKSLISPAT